MSDSPEPALERSLYYGMLFQFALWTLELYLYAGTVYRFFTKESSRDRKRARMYYTIAGGVILALLTVEVFANVVLLEFMWIDHRDFPGGPLGFFTVGSSAWWEIFGTATDMVANFIGDGILVYRCWAVWEANWIVMAGMVLLYLSSIAMALISLVQSALPGSQFFSGKTVNFGVPWTALSVSLNVFLTALIIYRIWHVRDTFRRISQTRPLSAYTGLAAVFYESSLPFSVLGIVYAITYGREVQEAPFFSFVWGTLVGLSPQIIIYRVASGSAFTSRSSAECETIASHIELVSRHGAELPTHIQDDAGSTSKSV